MAASIIAIGSSSMSLTMDKKDYFSDNTHFRWSSLRKFIYMAYCFSNGVFNFDMFSESMHKVRVIDFVFCEITIGMGYMFMDCFIKQYTRKMDAHKYLNPLLKGITWGLFMQTALWALLHAGYVADSLRFLATTFSDMPSWTTCHISVNVSCIPSKDIILRCQEHMSTNINTTSAHHNYMKSFKCQDQNILTTRFFIIGLVWMFNFFCSTFTDDTLEKIIKLVFMCRIFSTFVTLILILINAQYVEMTALLQEMEANTEYYLIAAMEQVTYVYGIGFLSFYDLGSIPPYTMIDNAVILFMLTFTILAVIRTWIIKVMYVMLLKCVAVEISIVTPHYFLFAVLPLSTEFLQVRKLYALYIYLNLIVSTSAYLTMLTLTLSKLLHTEFRWVKNLYIVGLLCCLGFGLSIISTVTLTTSYRVKGLMRGLNVTVLYLGGFKVAVIMWVYGVEKFSTDIHFWLGFKPTKFWKLCWMMMPLVLMCFLIAQIYALFHSKHSQEIITATMWIILSVLTVVIFHIKTFAKYIALNNLSAAFSSSKRYGPPDSDDRKLRRFFNETTNLRQCRHNCHILDKNTTPSAELQDLQLGARSGNNSSKTPRRPKLVKLSKEHFLRMPRVEAKHVSI